MTEASLIELIEIEEPHGVEPIVVSALKPGVYTSEFWLSLGVTVVALLGALGFADAEEPVRVVFAAVAVVVPAVYSTVRTLIKRG